MFLEMAQKIEDRAPGRVRWDLCGDGAMFGELQRRHNRKGLKSIVSLHGWMSPEAQRHLRAISHAVIVPTRSTFPEGIAMTAIEGILAVVPSSPIELFLR